MVSILKKVIDLSEISVFSMKPQGALYRQLKLAHPMQDFMDLIVKLKLEKTIRVTKVKLDKLVELMPESDNGKEDDTS